MRVKFSQTYKKNNGFIWGRLFSSSSPKLYPGVSLRKKSVHQKGIATFKRKIGNADENTPFCVVVVCQDRWIRDEDYLQDYSIIVSVSHESNVKLYAKVRAKNQVQQRVRT